MANGMTGDDELAAVNGDEIESVGKHRFETPESYQRHVDLLKEGNVESGPAEGLGEDGVDITDDEGPVL